jgi:hypothetical protein
MNIESTLRRLLEIGRSERFSEIAGIPGLQDHSSVLQLAGVYHDDIVSFTKVLSSDDRVAFVKAVAMVEHSVGGLGSVTNLERLFPLADDPERTVLDWVLRNTKSYSYYSHDARSVEELELTRKRIAERRAARVQKERTRQAEDKTRIAAEATKTLYNAVRRGDLKAVRALMKQGADATSCGPDGSSLIVVALSKGFDAIAAELRHSNDDNAAP